MKRFFAVGITILAYSELLLSATLKEENELMFSEMKHTHHYTDGQIDALRKIFLKSGFAGQGNPSISNHPMTRDQCQVRVRSSGKSYESDTFLKICGYSYMAPLYNPKTQKPEDAQSCIDQFEFPNIPCAYPVTWVRAHEAQEICSTLGKRLCDAHEWEGACSGALEASDYPFKDVVGLKPELQASKMRMIHNTKHAPTKSWAYGDKFLKGVCPQDSEKSALCNPSGNVWNTCGTNTYPSGSFPNCKSRLDVYDIHGNAAEHMNLPTNEDEMTSKGSKTLGLTEMKGSWFIWDKFQAHQDWCRWRAPFWHGSRVMDANSHHNYHLGFRCCSSRN